MMFLIRHLLIFAATVMVIAAEPGELVSVELGGYIVGVSAAAGDVQIMRDGVVITVVKPMALAVGDRILISNRARVVLQTNQSRQRREIRAVDSPFIVTGPPAPPRGVARFVDALINDRQGLREILDAPPVRHNYVDSKGVNSCPSNASGVEPLRRARAIDQDEQGVWGDQSLFIVWASGRAPFSVKFLDASMDARLLVDRICENGTSVKLPEFTSDHARLEVSDATGATVSWFLHRLSAPPVRANLPSGIDAVTEELVRALDALGRPDRRTSIMGLTLLNDIEQSSAIAWRLILAAREDRDL